MAGSTADEIAGILFVRRVASAYRSPSGVVDHLALTIEGVRRAVSTSSPGGRIEFQGVVLTCADFVATWAVELAIHHLDLDHREDRGGHVSVAAMRLARETVGRSPAHASPRRGATKQPC